MNQAEHDLLVMSAQDGNQRAFGFLVKEFHKPLINFAFKMSLDRELACDAVQDSWIKIAKNLRKLKDPRAFKSWIYRLVRWKVLDMLRVKTRESARLEPINNALVFDSQVDQIEKMDEVGSLIKALPKLEKEIVHLFYLDELKISEIAIVLEIPEGTVKSRLNRARNMLRTNYQKLED